MAVCILSAINTCSETIRTLNSPACAIIAGRYLLARDGGTVRIAADLDDIRQLDEQE